MTLMTLTLDDSPCAVPTEVWWEHIFANEDADHLLLLQEVEGRMVPPSSLFRSLLGSNASQMKTS